MTTHTKFYKWGQKLYEVAIIKNSKIEQLENNL